MKIKPAREPSGLDLPVALAASRRRIGRAVDEDNAAVLGEHFAAWRAWIVRIENDRSLAIGGGSSVVFHWTCGSSMSARFETACAAYAYARALFHLRRYALAHAHFGLALEEVAQCRDPLPLTPAACGAFRLRCLVRAQRLAICELEIAEEPRRVLALANWLAFASREYAKFSSAARKEPLAAGESLAAAARAVLAGDPADAKKARGWARNPFAADAAHATRGGRRDASVEPLSTDGEFDWTRFVSSELYSA